MLNRNRTQRLRPMDLQYRIQGQVPDAVDLWEHDGDVIFVGKLDGEVYSSVYRISYDALPIEVKREVRHA